MRLKTHLTARPLMLALAVGTLSLSAWAQSPAASATPAPLPGAQTQAGEPAGAAGGERRWREQGMTQRHHQHMERRQQRQTQALASLASDLQLQPAQQAAWQRFEQAMKSRPTPLATSATNSPVAQSLPARIAELKARKAQRDAAFEQRLQAVLDLHASLDKAQQQVLDARAERWLQRHRGEPGRRHGMADRHGGDRALHGPLGHQSPQAHPGRVPA